MKSSTVLGKGLASLIPIKSNRSRAEETRNEKGQEVSVHDIHLNPMQPRLSFDPVADDGLLRSIREHGILQPLIVTKGEEGYILIAGERRLRAAKALGLSTVPVVVRSADRQQQLEVSLIENIQRQDLNPIDEAQAYRRLQDEFHLIQEEISKRVGKHRATIANTLRLLELPPDIQEALVDRKLSVGHAKVLLSLPTREDQIRVFRTIARTSLNVEETNEVVRRIKSRRPSLGVRDPELSEKEEELQSLLGTKVRITHRGKGGKIIINFYSKEELDALVEKMVSSQS